MPGLLMEWMFAVKLLTFGLADHDVAVLALPPVVKALHLDIVGGLGLEVSNHVPGFHT